MTASLLVSFTVVATGDQGKPAGTGPAWGIGRLRPYDTVGDARRRRTAERGRRRIHAQPDSGPVRPQGGSQRACGGGGIRTGRRALRPSLRGVVERFATRRPGDPRQWQDGGPGA